MFIDHCLICDNVCDNTFALKAPVCSSCLATLKSEMYDTFMARCPNCYYPIVGSEYRCPRCKKTASGTAFTVYCVSTYDGDLSYSVLQRFKFHDDKRLAKVVALMLKEALPILDPEGTSVIVPIPCSKQSLKKRGWDQMKEVAKYLDRKVLPLLVNTSNSSSQQKLLDRFQRLTKSSKRFEFNKSFNLEETLKALKNRSLILIDDVSTTFSTLTAAHDHLVSLDFEDVKAMVWLYDLKAERL